jgi:hypothetical protein
MILATLAAQEKESLSDVSIQPTLQTVEQNKKQRESRVDRLTDLDSNRLSKSTGQINGTLPALNDQMVPSCYETGMFITVFTKAHLDLLHLGSTTICTRHAPDNRTRCCSVLRVTMGWACSSDTTKYIIPPQARYEAELVRSSCIQHFLSSVSVCVCLDRFCLLVSNLNHNGSKSVGCSMLLISSLPAAIQQTSHVQLASHVNVSIPTQTGLECKYLS